MYTSPAYLALHSMKYAIIIQTNVLVITIELMTY